MGTVLEDVQFITQAQRSVLLRNGQCAEIGEKILCGGSQEYRRGILCHMVQKRYILGIFFRGGIL